MTTYPKLKDLIAKEWTQGMLAYMEMCTGISKDFLTLSLDEQDRIRISFSAAFSETSPYRYGATITPEWTTLESTECAKHLATCLRGFEERNLPNLMEAETRLHEQTKHDLSMEYFPKYSYGDLATEFGHLIEGCAMNETSQEFTASFHGHNIEIYTDLQTKSIQFVSIDGKEVYDHNKGMVGHEGIAELMVNAICESLYKEGMYDCERTLQEFDEAYGVSQLNKQDGFDQELGEGREINWMDDLMFDPIGQDEWER